MKLIKYSIKKVIAIISTICIICTFMAVSLVPAYASEDAETRLSSSGNWSVYVQSGTYHQTQIVSLYTYGNGYVATCTAASGNCASMKTTITGFKDYKCTSSYPLNKTVSFTRKDASITFNTNSAPTTSVIYMKANLTYSNGTIASMAGNIRTNS